MVERAAGGGLTTERARALLAIHGPNQLVPGRRRSASFDWLLRAVSDPMAVLLLLASATYVALQDYAEAAVTAGALVPITAVTLLLERRAERTLEQLRRRTAPTATVWRDERRQAIPVEELVPGDLILVHEGDIIPADASLVDGAALVLDESALTGEAHPVIKDASAPEEDDRLLMAGTTLRAGRGTARVITTGAATQYGRIGGLVAGITPPPTPLQRLINRLIRQLARGAVVLCASVFVVELAQGHGWAAGIIAAVSLGIAAVPEEFPVVYTLYLALGAWRLAKARALVRRLTGVEALGATTVICADKTGTLTLGRIDVAALYSPSGMVRGGRLSSEAEELVREAVRASEPHPFDPMDQAILRFASANGIDVAALHTGTLVQDYPFYAAGKYNSHVWRRDGETWISAKGAAEGILERSRSGAEERRSAVEAHQRLAAEGLRIIAVAGGPLRGTVGDRDADETHLRFVGLVAFSDPLRPGVAEALHECAQAGIRVAMVTGDHPVTAHAVAEGLGLAHTHELPVVTGEDLDSADEATLRRLVSRVNIFARVRPEQKYRLVRALRNQGEIVAMTGDGVNDAPALREADVGVAMGERGTEVARQAATIVLLDDNFATLVMAVQEGRRIFDDLRRAFAYLIAFHTPILLTAVTVPLLGAPLLLLPLHLVWLELIVHPTASLVFEYDPPSPDLMRRPPRRPGAGLVDWIDFLRASGTGLTLCCGVLGLYLWGLRADGGAPHARGIALAALVLGQIVLVLSARSPANGVWRAPLRGNPMLVPVLGITAASLAAVLYVSPIASVLEMAPPSGAEWLAAAGVAGAATLWYDVGKAVRTRRSTGRRAAEEA